MMVKNIWLALFTFIIVSANSQLSQLWTAYPNGGINQHGILIKINGDGSGFEELISMDTLDVDNVCCNLTLYGNYVYGFAYKNNVTFLYRVNTASKVYEKLSDLPSEISKSKLLSKLCRLDGRYYFISAHEGSLGYGGLYVYDEVSNTISIVNTLSKQTGFYTGTYGQINGLIVSDSSLYGAATYGGQYSKGTIYRYTPTSNTFEVVYNFGDNKSKAAYPTSEMVATDNFSLFGFSSDTSEDYSLTQTVIYSFDKTTKSLYELRLLSKYEGAVVYGQIAFAPDGYIYAASRHGGDYSCSPPKDFGCGALIRYRPYDNHLEKLYNFSNPLDGSHWSNSNYNYFNPGITFGYDGNLYSTAGNSSDSYAYSFNINTNEFNSILNNYLKHPTLPIGAYYNFVNVTNGYLDINDESIRDIDVKVYPNPAKQLVNIELKTEKNAEVGMFELFDLVGRRLHKITFTEKLFQINVEGLTAGLYCWKYSTVKGTKTGKLLIATHD